MREGKGGGRRRQLVRGPHARKVGAARQRGQAAAGCSARQHARQCSPGAAWRAMGRPAPGQRAATVAGVCRVAHCPCLPGPPPSAHQLLKARSVPAAAARSSSSTARLRARTRRKPPPLRGRESGSREAVASGGHCQRRSLRAPGHVVHRHQPLTKAGATAASAPGRHCFVAGAWRGRKATAQGHRPRARLRPLASARRRPPATRWRTRRAPWPMPPSSAAGWGCPGVAGAGRGSARG